MNTYYFATNCSYSKNEADKAFNNAEDAIAYALNNANVINNVDEYKVDGFTVKSKNNMFCRPNCVNLYYAHATTYRCGKKQFVVKKNGKDRFNLKIADNNATTIQFDNKNCVGIELDNQVYLLVSVCNNKTKQIELWAVPQINEHFVSNGLLKFKEIN